MVSAQRSRASEVSPVATDCTALTALEEAAGGDAALLAALQSIYRKARMERQRSAQPRVGYQSRTHGPARQQNQSMKRKTDNIVFFACGQSDHIRAQRQHYVNVLEA